LATKASVEAWSSTRRCRAWADPGKAWHRGGQDSADRGGGFDGPHPPARQRPAPRVVARTLGGDVPRLVVHSVRKVLIRAACFLRLVDSNQLRRGGGRAGSLVGEGASSARGLPRVLGRPGRAISSAWCYGRAHLHPWLGQPLRRHTHGSLLSWVRVKVSTVDVAAQAIGGAHPGLKERPPPPARRASCRGPEPGD